MRRRWVALFLSICMFNSTSFASDDLILDVECVEEENKVYTLGSDGSKEGKVFSSNIIEDNQELEEDTEGMPLLKEDVLICLGMSELVQLDGDIVSFSTSDASIADVENSLIVSKGVGECFVMVESTSGLYSYKVSVIDPIVNTDNLTLEDEDFKVNVIGDLKGANVSYTVISDSEDVSINEIGEVHVPAGERCIIRVDVANKVFLKEINAVSLKKKLWDRMQDGIQECLGTPYVMGGFSPGSALDCSGYVSYVYNTVGLMSGRTTAQGLYNMSKKVENPEPGDMVFFQGTYDCPDYITHVGIYAGDGMMYHSGKPNQKTSITGYYAQHLVGYGTLIY